MPDEKVLQVAILIWGCVLCAIAALCMRAFQVLCKQKKLI